ncbi:MAG: CRTAC1 family protein [Planctomycetes bacterium]|nr:CRTAC1 family protein [Planctomycetota bacterium]
MSQRTTNRRNRSDRSFRQHLALAPRGLAVAALATVCALAGCGDSATPEPSNARVAPHGPSSPNSGAADANTSRASGAAPVAGTAQADAAGDLVDEARERGLDYFNRSGEPEKRTILEANGAGVAALDLGRDGDLDLVFTQGLATLAQAVTGPGADVEVFVNDGNGRFTRAQGPGLSGWWTGIAAGDVDSDGDEDVVVGGFGGLRVLLQDEHGELELGADLLADAPLERLEPGAPREKGHPPRWTSSLALYDGDRDGKLDLYVGNYLELDPVAPTIGKVGEGAVALPCRWKGYDVYCGPHGLVPQKDRLYRGVGDGRFEEITDRAYPTQVPGYTLGVIAFDADQDGDDDLYVANDSVPNNLLVNDGTGKFSDMALAAGVALSQDGAPQAGMGLAFGDVDRNGEFDLAVTNFSGEPTELYLAAERGFARITYKIGLAKATKPLLSWGTHLVDFDGDGRLELFTANGHVYPQADLEGTGTSYGQAATAWRLELGTKLVALEPKSERSLFAPKLGARGSAIGDFDGDLAPDLVLVRIDGPVALGMNRFAPAANRLALRCLGPDARETNPGGGRERTPVDGHGTRVIVVPKTAAGGEHALIAEQVTAQSYQSASAPWLYFGLGTSTEYESIRVLWPSGRVETLPAGQANRALTIREGRGVVAEVARR